MITESNRPGGTPNVGAYVSRGTARALLRNLTGAPGPAFSGPKPVDVQLWSWFDCSGRGIELSELALL